MTRTVHATRLFLSAATLAGLCCVEAPKRPAQPNDPATAFAEAAKRAFDSRTGPPADTLPPKLVGPDTRDANGYPMNAPSAVRLQRLLRKGDFATLTADLGDFQAAFEKDPKTYRWILIAAYAFNTCGADCGPQLNAWVTANPTSFAPYLARGYWWLGTGADRRGSAWARDTPPENFDGMNEAYRTALVDLNKSLELNSRVVAADQAKLRALHTLGPEDEYARVLAAVLAACPTCQEPRAEHMLLLAPRWGGSYGQMEAFAKIESTRGPEVSRKLSWLVAMEKGRVAEHDKEFVQAKKWFDEACAATDRPDPFHSRGAFLARRGDDVKAIEDYNTALARDPTDWLALFYRGGSHIRLRHLEEGCMDFINGMQLAPPNDEAKRYIPWAAKELMTTSSGHEEAGNFEEAIRLVDIALRLDPHTMNARSQRARLWRKANAVLFGADGGFQYSPEAAKRVQEFR